MARRKKRSPIPVESRSQEDRMTAALRQLRSFGDTEAIEKVVSAAEAFVACHVGGNESEAEWAARIKRISPGRAVAN